jgi:glycosyltransferase involved in cell wall biosynthesis
MDLFYRVKISIITINLNNLSGLKKTFSSVLAQTYSNIEFIIIDGLSIDGSKDYLELNSKKIDYWITESDTGVYHAMNKGWKIAHGSYILFLNSGDIFADSDVLKNLCKLIDPSADIVYGCHLWGSKDGARWNPKKDFKFREILNHTPISHQATFIKKTQLEKVGGFKSNYKIIADWGVLIDSMLINARFQKISLDICIAEEAGVSNVTEKEVLKERRLYLLRHHFLAFFLNKYVVLPVISLYKKIFG